MKSERRVLTDDQKKQLLSESVSIAVVGLSANPDRDSFRVAAYMQARGYQIIPVNTKYETVLGEPCYPDLLSIGRPVDIVNVFRRSCFVPEIVDDALALGCRAIWLQLGIYHQAAVSKARRSSIPVVADECIMVEHKRLIGLDGSRLGGI